MDKVLNINVVFSATKGEKRRSGEKFIHMESKIDKIVAELQRYGFTDIVVLREDTNENEYDTAYLALDREQPHDLFYCVLEYVDLALPMLSIDRVIKRLMASVEITMRDRKPSDKVRVAEYVAEMIVDETTRIRNAWR